MITIKKKNARTTSGVYDENAVTINWGKKRKITLWKFVSKMAKEMSKVNGKRVADIKENVRHRKMAYEWKKKWLENWDDSQIS